MRAAVPVSALSVAVFPFENRSPDTTDAYLADGLTEEIGNRLTQLGKLQIKSRGQVRAQWRRTPEPIAAARALNVAWFVHGNLRHVGNQLLVNVELVHSSGEEAWASRFPRRDADVFAVQAEIAESVAVVVGGRLSPTEHATITRRPTTNNEAYRLYLFANALVARRTAEDVRKAVDAYGQALALDPSFTGAWARLAIARNIQQSWGWEPQIGDSALNAMTLAAARRAIALDSTSSDAWLAMATGLSDDGDLQASHEAFERSIARDPSSAETYHLYAAILFSRDCLVGCTSIIAKAMPLLRQALQLDPTLRNSWRHLAGAERDSGMLELAEAHLDTALSFGPWPPASADRAYTRYLRGNLAGAEADIPLGHGSAQDRPWLPALIALARGDSAPIRAELAQARADTARDVTTQAGIAELDVLLGLREEALASLERALPFDRESMFRCNASTPCSPNLRLWRSLHEPGLAALRNEPRFQRLWDLTRPRAAWLGP